MRSHHSAQIGVEFHAYFINLIIMQHPSCGRYTTDLLTEWWSQKYILVNNNITLYTSRNSERRRNIGGGRSTNNVWLLLLLSIISSSPILRWTTIPNTLFLTNAEVIEDDNRRWTWKFILLDGRSLTITADGITHGASSNFESSPQPQHTEIIEIDNILLSHILCWILTESGRKTVIIYGHWTMMNI
jgi:hypothetical protein